MTKYIYIISTHKKPLRALARCIDLIKGCCHNQRLLCPMMKGCGWWEDDGLALYWLQPLAWHGWADTYSAGLQISGLQRGKSASSCCSASSGSCIIRPPANQPQHTVIQNKELYSFTYLEIYLYLNRKQARISQQTIFIKKSEVLI